MLIIHGRISSINVQKVVFAAGELGLAYERREAGGAFGRVDSPEYRAMNPNGKVPVIEEDGFILWESNAIVRYLAAGQGAGSLWPEAPRARADADRWMDWQATEATPAMRNVFWQIVRTKPEARDQASIATSLRQSETMMALLDRQLAGRPFVTGAAFTVADIALGPLAHRWLNLPLAEAGLARAPRPNIERWYAGLRSRPAASPAMPLPIT
jgi:glutathione S-transferase